MNLPKRACNMAKYSTVFLDLDGTVLDFHASERLSFESVFDGLINGDVGKAYLRYKEINAEMWLDLEQAKVTFDELKIARFEKLFKEFDIIGQDPAEVNEK